MSEIRTNLLKSERGDASPSAPFGLRVSGITTTGTLNVTANATIDGNLGVAGTITYEDVARVDATGISTFREGFKLGPITGVALTAYNDGSIRSTGIIPATSYYGDGSNLSGIAGGLQEIDLWTITADSSNTNWDDGDNDVLGGGSFGVNIARCTTTQNAMFAKQGTGMSYSSGVFTFPSTGTYEVLANLFYRPSETGNKFMHLFMQLTGVIRLVGASKQNAELNIHSYYSLTRPQAILLREHIEAYKISDNRIFVDVNL